MRRSLFVLPLIVWAQCAAAEQCGLKQIATYALASADEVPVVSLLVEGTPQSFAVPFSATHTGIPEAWVDAMHLHQMQGDTSGLWAAGHQVTHLAAANIQLGPLRGREFAVFVIPKEAGLDIGVLGADILTKFDVELDLAHTKLILFSQDHCRGQVVYWTRAYAVAPMDWTRFGTFSFKMQLDGKPIDAIVDAGLEHTRIQLGVFKSVLGLDEHSPGMTEMLSGGDSSIRTFRYPFKSLASGPLAINNPVIEIVDDPSLRCIGAPYHEFFENACEKTSLSYLRLGRNVLRALHFYFAHDEKSIYLTPADAH